MQRVTNRMKAISFAPVCALACLLAASATARSESFWTRDTLTGNWGGLRTGLAERGVIVELSSTGYYAGLLSGGVADDEFDFGGRADLLIHTDFGRLGLWDGGGLHIHAESRFGDAAERTAPRSGGVWPPNTGVVLPVGESGRIVASSLYFTQTIGASATLMLGKINAVDLLALDPFFGGWARDRFINIAFVAPPSGVVPPVIMGGILSYRWRPFETGVEFFYNLAATPWFRITADIQWIDPARADFGRAWVAGLRANIQY